MFPVILAWIRIIPSHLTDPNYTNMCAEVQNGIHFFNWMPDCAYLSVKDLKNSSENCLYCSSVASIITETSSHEPHINSHNSPLVVVDISAYIIK